MAELDNSDRRQSADVAAALAAGRFGEARALLQRALAAAPQVPRIWASLADCLLMERRPEEAVAVCEAGLARLPAAVELHCAKAQALQALSRVADAAAAYRQALTLDPGCAAARLGLALQAVEAGAWDEADALIAPLRAASPPPAVDWLSARIALGRGDHAAALEAGRRAAADPSLTAPQRSETLLLMGEALDGLGRHAEAFQAFGEGKSALRALYAERAAGRESELDRLSRLEAWFRDTDAAPWRAAPPSPDDPDRPGHVFLVGFPRSGTTLLEQALAGHPDLVSLEEAPTLAEPFAALMGSDAGLQRLARLSPAEAAAWRAAYWREVDARAPDARGRVFLDKAPAGTPHLPLIAKLFPAARVLFALRDPRDVVLSCYRNSFQMNALTYAFTDLAETARCHAAAMTLAGTYRRLLPTAILDVRYERLVDDFEGELAKVARFVGLDLRGEMLDVAATARRRSIRTPSAQQVRAGLGRGGLARWRAYEAQLAPVSQILAPWVDALGYGAAG